MMWRMMKTVTIVGLIALGLGVIGRTLIDQNDFVLQIHDVPKQLEVSAMDKLTAEDLSMTTSMFLKQLSAQLQRWADADLSNEKLRREFEEELNEHPHFHGFAVIKDGKVIEEVGQVERMDISTLTHHHMNSEFSDPYKVNGENFMLMGEKLDDGRTVLGEVNLTFLKSFVKNLASVADSNGTFFVSGDDPKVDWKTTEDLPENLESETVPEIGWQIVVHSKEEDAKEKHYHPNQAVIRFKHPETAETWFIEHAELNIIENNNPMYIVESKSESTEALIRRLKQDYDLAIAEPNYIITNQITLFSTTPEQRTEPKRAYEKPQQTNTLSTVPNDEFFAPYQWNLSQIEIEEGWNFSSGQDVSIAVLDTGVDPNHLDLQNKLVHGYNALDDSGSFDDAHGHGTHVAGIAAALTNNVTGIAGVSWDSSIIPIKVLNDQGEGSSYEVAKGIYWAVDHGASVINMSLGDYHPSDILHEAIKYAYERDVVLIAASGNDNVSDPMYPAQYEEVLTVAAVDQARNRAFFSNFGNHIDIAAPGEHIPSLFPNNGYVVMSGTSMAAPHVAGLAGLIRSLRPNLTNEQVYEVITSTAKDLGTQGYDPYYGFGEIDIKAALESIANM